MTDYESRLSALESAYRRTARSLALWRGLALAAAALTIGVPAIPAQQDGSPEPAARSSLARRVRSLERQVQGQQALIAALQTALAEETDGRVSADATLQAGLAPLVQKLARVSVLNGGDDLVITGANLHVVNGLGTTDTTNGLGNLIVGYNELRGGGADNRNGSHNLVVGRYHNYLQFGSLVAGETNEVRGAFASVTGGHGGVASGAWSSITGGHGNTASGIEASVTGGWANLAFGPGASVSGGDHNVASGSLSTVSGGAGNRANVGGAVVSGGRNNSANGLLSTVSGGSSRGTFDTFDWVAGSLFQDF